MARRKVANPFQDRTNRLKKLSAAKYHQTTVGENVYLIYRRGKNRSTWYVRLRGHGFSALGIADDFHDADGRDVLTYHQACELALERARESDRNDRPVAKRGGYTVRDATDEYIKSLQAQGKKSVREIQRVIDTDVLPELGSTALSDLTAGRINSWITKLVNAPRRTRSGNELPVDDSAEGKRKRRATAQRKWNVLRAALNYAAKKLQWVDGRAWAGIGNQKSIDPPEDDFPALEECQRLIRRTSDDFRPIVEATLLTGAAYSELTALEVRDYTPSTGHLRVFNSKRRSRQIPLTDEGLDLFDGLTAGRSAAERIFLHDDGRPFGKSEQHRPMVEANKAAKLDPPITLTRLRKTYGSLLLNAGVPLEVVSKAMGHSDPSVTRRHYSRLLQPTIDEHIRGALPKIAAGKKKVARIH